jgi:hypothetical protein
MSYDNSTDNAATGQKRPGALQLGPRKKSYVLTTFGLLNAAYYFPGASCATDPLVHYGRHFGRTLHVFCTVGALLSNGILRMGELSEQSEDTLTHEFVFPFSSYNAWLTSARERREHRIFQALLQMIPGLEERLMEGSNEDVIHVAELVRGNCFDEFPN